MQLYEHQDHDKDDSRVLQDTTRPEGMANVINPERNNLPIYQFTIWKIHFYNGQGG